MDCFQEEIGSCSNTDQQYDYFFPFQRSYKGPLPGASTTISRPALVYLTLEFLGISSSYSSSTSLDITHLFK